MGIEINVFKVNEEINKLSLELKISNVSAKVFNVISDVFIIESHSGGPVLFQVMVNELCVNQNEQRYERTLFIRLTKQISTDERIYNIIKYTHKCVEETSKERCLTTDDGTWRLIDDCLDGFKNIQLNASVFFSLEIIAVVNVPPSCNQTFFETLRDDTELTDFELRGVDGSIHLHKAVAAARSPVFKTMFGGTWRETKEGAVDVKDTSKDTLQHLKDYMYLGQVPETGLEQLLLLASFYMMPELRLQCVNKLKSTATADTVCDLIAFAVNHHLSDLLVALLLQVENGKVNVENIEVASL